MSGLRSRGSRETTIIFTYGCPRSGTTFVQRLFANLGAEYVVEKIREGDKAHPCQTDTGLLMLAQLFRDRNVVFVRSVRSPLGIFESFYAAKHIHETTGSLGGLAGNTDERIRKFILDERNNTSTQVLEHSMLVEREGVNAATLGRLDIVEFDYDTMRDRSVQHEFIANVCEHVHAGGRSGLSRLLSTRLLDFGDAGAAARRGRLSERITKSLVPQKLKDEIAKL